MVRIRASIHCSVVNWLRPAQNSSRDHAAHLDRLEARDDEGIGPVAETDAVVVVHEDVAPDAGRQQALVLLHELGRDVDVVDVGGHQAGPVHALFELLVQLDLDQVDQPPRGALADRRLDHLRLVAARDVRRHLLLHQPQTFGHIVVVEDVGAVLVQHELDDVGRRLGRPADLLRQVFAHDQAGERRKQQAVQVVGNELLLFVSHSMLRNRAVTRRRAGTELCPTARSPGL